MKKKINIIFILLTSLAVLLSACSNNNPGNTTGTDASQADKAFNETIDLTGVNKDKKSDEENGKRIVMDSVALSSIADKLDIKLAGVPTSKLGKMPARYNNIIQIGLPMNPNMEVIKSIKPSMVYAPDNLSDWLKEGFDKNNIPYKFVDLRSVDGLYKVTEELANEFNKKEINNKLKQERQLFESQFTKKLKGKKKPKVLILMGLPGSYLAAGEKSYVGNLVKLAGGENIIKSNEEFSQLNLETMPDEVMDMFKKEFSSNKSWQHFNAVKNNKVINLDNKIFGMTAGFDYSDGLNFLYDSFYR